jgi:hypothetical protein
MTTTIADLTVAMMIEIVAMIAETTAAMIAVTTDVMTATAPRITGRERGVSLGWRGV